MTFEVKKCLECGKKFTPRMFIQHYCNILCSAKAVTRNGKLHIRPLDKTRVCPRCKKEFTPTTGTATYCSYECTQKTQMIRDKMRRNKKEYITTLATLLGILFMANSYFFFRVYAVEDKKVISPVSDTSFGKVIEEPKPLTTEEIICSYDWDCDKALKIVECESGFDQYAINHNTNGTYDLGLWQINDVHKISKADRFDVRRSTEYAYKIYQQRGNKFTAWVCAVNMGIE